MTRRTITIVEPGTVSNLREHRCKVTWYVTSVVLSIRLHIPSSQKIMFRHWISQGEQIAWLSNEAGAALAPGSGSPRSALQALAQTVMKTCRRLSMKIGCYNAAAIPPHMEPGGSSTAPRTSQRSRRSTGLRISTPPREPEREDDDIDVEPDFINSSQLQDAPLHFTQSQGDEAVSKC